MQLRSSILGLLIPVLTLVGARRADADEPTPPPAVAAPALDPSATRTFTLADGSIYRGEIVELVPNDHVVLKLATGEIKRIAWSSLARPATPAVPDAPPAPPPEAPAPNGVSFALRSVGRGVSLLRDAGDNWVLVCNAPCEAKLDPTQRYRVGGPGVSSSKSFRVPVGAPPLSIAVSPGDSAARIPGGIFLGLGLIAAVSGVVLVATAPSSYQVAGYYGETDTVDPGAHQREAGIASAIAGGVVALLGIAFFVKASTSLSGDTAGLTYDASAKPSGPVRFAWTPTGFVF